MLLIPPITTHPFVTNPPINAELAIIIPAYKSRHFVSTLESLAGQTADRSRFHVYIADDGSPENMEAIARPYVEKFNFSYQRFPENLGRTSLIRHWHRAIQLSHEPWVWVFSDDDEVTPDTVDAVLEVIDGLGTARPLIRIPLQIVNEEGRLLHQIEYPYRRTHEEYLNDHVTRLELFCAMQNVVFARSTYEKVGGFEDLPGGMFSDLASWPRFARVHGVQLTRRGCVRFRDHAGSLSGGAKVSREKRRALIASMGPYFRSMQQEFDYIPPERRMPYPGLGLIAEMMKFYPSRLSWSEMRTLDAQAMNVWPRMKLNTRGHLWAAMLRPWMRLVRQTFDWRRHA